MYVGIGRHQKWIWDNPADDGGTETNMLGLTGPEIGHLLLSLVFVLIAFAAWRSVSKDK